jgi:hypothetical protein
VVFYGGAMHWAVLAAAGGVAGTALLSLLLLMLEVETRSGVRIFAAIARFAGVPGNVALGVVGYLLAGAVAWPLLFTVVEEVLPVADPAVEGMAFAVPLWTAFVVVGGSGMNETGLAVYASFTLLAHLAYGYMLGTVYARLADPEEVVVRGAGS